MQLAPGVVVNTQGGFGNVEAFGLPATSNLFTLDGMDDNDPFLNLNNSGATNLLLGQNEPDAAWLQPGEQPKLGEWQLTTAPADMLRARPEIASAVSAGTPNEPSATTSAASRTPHPASDTGTS